MRFPRANDLHIDVDKLFNHLVPHNFVHRFPKPIAHFLGYREKPRKNIGNVLVGCWALLGTFVGIIIIEAVFLIPEIRRHGPPLLIGSFGAAAVLEYNTIESPLAQPRNTIFGHVIGTATAVGVVKLFMLNPNFEDIRWLAAGMACGTASFVMTMTKTVYPPAGATALLAAVDPQVQQLGWYLIPLVLLSATITLIVSLVVNNIQRQYPTYWWTPVDVTRHGGSREIEKLPADVKLSEKVFTSDDGLSETREAPVGELDPHMLRVTADRIIVPECIFLSAEETRMLEILRTRLGQGMPQPQKLTEPV